jgi:hypothetical protein
MRGAYPSYDLIMECLPQARVLSALSPGGTILEGSENGVKLQEQVTVAVSLKADLGPWFPPLPAYFLFTIR